MDTSLALQCSKIIAAQTSLRLVHMNPKCLPGPSTPVLLTNKVATTRQATHLEGETYDIVRDLFSALSFEKTLSAAQKRGLPQKFMSLDYRV